ncbi:MULTISPECIES: response regulator [Dehalobacter]|nr:MULTISPECIES: response regulator [Dehalobacter]MDJ0305259.1 response regulator [Dehalobacter sp.]
MRPVVMVIDDDTSIANLLSTMLISNGYTPIIASNGYSALTMLKSCPHPTLILTDYSMPILNGCEFIEKVSVQKNLKDIPVIMISGSDIEERKLPKTTNFKGIIQKPFKINTVLDVIKHHAINHCDSSLYPA